MNLRKLYKTAGIAILLACIAAIAAVIAIAPWERASQAPEKRDVGHVVDCMTYLMDAGKPIPVIMSEHGECGDVYADHAAELARAMEGI